MKWRQWLAANTGVVWLAFALRAYLLDGQSLWYDEGISAAMAPRSLPLITAAAASDIHPPLYYYLSHIWWLVAGDSEYSLRFLSVVCGVLLVPVMMVVGRSIFGSLVASIAGILVATSPLLIYYSQEARMYALLMLLVAGLMYLVSRPRPYAAAWWAAAIFVTSVLSLYTHYLAISIIPVTLVALLFSTRGRALWRWWMVAFGGVAALWAPWAAHSALQVAGRTGPGVDEYVSLSDFVARIIAVFAYGLSFDATLTGNAWLATIVLMAGGLLWLRYGGFLGIKMDSSGESRAWMVLLWAVAPVAATYLLWVLRPLYNPVINPRFALPAAPAFYLWLAAGIIAIAKVIHWLRIRLCPP